MRQFAATMGLPAVLVTACTLIQSPLGSGRDSSSDADETEGTDADSDVDIDSDVDSDTDTDTDTDADGDVDMDIDTDADIDDDTDAEGDAEEACVVDCTGRDCGDDGCGGSCGVCPGYAVCEESSWTCVPTIDCSVGAGWGASCVWDEGCRGEDVCYRIVWVDWDGEICTTECTGNEDCPDIAPGDERCSRTANDGTRYCAVHCESNDDCPCDQECYITDGRDHICHPHW